MAELADDEIPTVYAYGHGIAEVDVDSLPESQQRRARQMQELREVIRQVDRGR